MAITYPFFDPPMAQQPFFLGQLPTNTNAFKTQAPPNNQKGPHKVERKTSPAPPGLSSTQEFPPLAAPSAPPSSVPPPLQRKQTAGKNIKPVVPVVPPPSTRVSTGAKDLHITETDLIDKVTGPSEATETQSAINVSNPPSSSAYKDSTTEPKVERKEVGTIAHGSEKKQRLEKLDTAEIKDTPQKGTLSTSKGGAKKPASDESEEPIASEPPTPMTSVSQTSASGRTRQPRTIRVAQEDVQPPLPSNPLPAAESQYISRKPSLSSVNRPETPFKTEFSDNASYTSMSRASSPPLSGRVGTAPVRHNTKSQQKKERQARAKATEPRTEDLSPKAEEVQAPIVGRKKKTKKNKPTTGTADSTPTATRPPSPAPGEESTEEKYNEVADPVTPVKDKRNRQSSVSEAKDLKPPSTPATPAGAEQHKAPTTAGSIFTSLRDAGEISGSAADLFKPVPGTNYRFESIAPNSDALSISLSDDELQAIGSGMPVHIKDDNYGQVVVLPDSRVIRGLTAEQADRYVELRRRNVLVGDQLPLYKTLDGLIPAVPTVTSAIQSSSSRASGKRLSNPFLIATETVEDSASDSARFGRASGKSDALGEKTVGLDLAEAEQALLSSRRETEVLEKKLNALMKKNRRMLFGSAH